MVIKTPKVLLPLRIQAVNLKQWQQGTYKQFLPGASSGNFMMD